ncbi:serine/threonine-protein phosphatase [Gluconobacter sphaericus]|uniref:PP2C family protein-serine/threonine phosphatase n=1 Tax=Gluconobacter sphaericus TaxID=574987 RepID=UPI001B8BCA2D|nr:protein phosphatase 2C domain-containing protein [Gluconobacter sphaericus]MBS1098432.1 serine/threonine-protein phosphatase [Gluconobacter sphaericus]
MKSVAFSIDGPKGNNQDRYLEPVESFRGWVAAVADGVGGRPGGEIAATEAITAAKDSASDLTWDGAKIFAAACQRIRGAEAHENKEQMATTMSLVRLVDDFAHVAHVGDSRIYHVRGGGILTRTEDQTEVASLLRDGVLSKAQAKSYPRRNVITSYLSSGAKFDLFSSRFAVEPGDNIVLLTDGAYDIIKKAHIVQELQQSSSLEEAAERFRQRLLLSGVKDDSTLVIVQI